MKNSDTSPSFAGRVVMSVAIATVLGGGAAILESSRTNAVQDQRLDGLENSMDRIDSLTDVMARTNTNVAVLNTNVEQLTKRLEEVTSVPRD